MKSSGSHHGSKGPIKTCYVFFGTKTVGIGRRFMRIRTNQTQTWKLHIPKVTGTKTKLVGATFLSKSNYLSIYHIKETHRKKGSGNWRNFSEKFSRITSNDENEKMVTASILEKFPTLKIITDFRYPRRLLEKHFTRLIKKLIVSFLNRGQKNFCKLDFLPGFLILQFSIINYDPYEP